MKIVKQKHLYAYTYVYRHQPTHTNLHEHMHTSVQTPTPTHSYHQKVKRHQTTHTITHTLHEHMHTIVLTQTHNYHQMYTSDTQVRTCAHLYEKKFSFTHTVILCKIKTFFSAIKMLFWILTLEKIHSEKNKAICRRLESSISINFHSIRWFISCIVMCKLPYNQIRAFL